jgi:dephospho-CoA kinase
MKVGLTGGIGSGKTMVAKIFQSNFAIPVYNADLAAKRIIASDNLVIQEIKNAFGEHIFDKYNNIDRQKLSAEVFSNKKSLDKLNAIVHPAVRKDFLLWTQNYINAPYVIEEAAILFETGYYKDFDKIISVIAPEELRIERVALRDNKDKLYVKNIIANQTSDEIRFKLSDFIIVNDGIKKLEPQVIDIHNKLLNN